MRRAADGAADQQRSAPGQLGSRDSAPIQYRYSTIVNSCVLVTTASRVRAGIVLCECSNAMCLRVHSCKSKSREVCIH